MTYDLSLPYVGIPEPLRSNPNWLANASILPANEQTIGGRTFRVGMRVRHIQESFGCSLIQSPEGEPKPLAGRLGTVRGFVRYRTDTIPLVHWDDTPIWRNGPESENPWLHFYWCSPELLAEEPGSCPPA